MSGLYSRLETELGRCIVSLLRRGQCGYVRVSISKQASQLIIEEGCNYADGGVHEKVFVLRYEYIIVQIRILYNGFITGVVYS